MAQWHGISRRKPSGARLKRPNRYRGKRRTEISSEKQFAFIDADRQTKVYRKRSGNTTVRVLKENMINVSDGSGKTQRVEMTNVVENGADPNYVRRNILTKGAIVETDLGRVRITSRPGMDGVISGVTIDE
ncbi:MAG TPA: 30S ribosomal protein S8e [Candidatus Thalassarchaeaceae archaeon]|nr:MAG TPA: 30S ribosomal protein S8e [Candidatus Poseidoniales archaeon]HII48653.1 30S ribosomal protein S8e [Candidatus Thalassarchaeaceae archaeon]|tara:strand:+ start:3794 stop:4186 length:393 start_codon:yes stop_codon:yes gene_type:complete